MTPRTAETATGPDEGTSPGNAVEPELTLMEGGQQPEDEEMSRLNSLPLHLQAAVARSLTGQDNGITLEQALSCVTRPASKPPRPSPGEVKIPRHLEMSGMSREQILKCMGY